MELQIRDMLPGDQNAKSFVHWKSWHEIFQRGNAHAIGFYEHDGFRFDGVVEDAPVGTEFRMGYQPNNS